MAPDMISLVPLTCTSMIPSKGHNSGNSGTWYIRRNVSKKFSSNDWKVMKTSRMVGPVEDNTMALTAYQELGVRGMSFCCRF